MINYHLAFPPTAYPTYEYTKHILVIFQCNIEFVLLQLLFTFDDTNLHGLESCHGTG